QPVAFLCGGSGERKHHDRFLRPLGHRGVGAIYVDALLRQLSGHFRERGGLWLPGRPLAAGCRAAARGTIVGRAEAAHNAHDAPQANCTCGVYAAKNLEHLRSAGYERFGIHGEVYLWGTVVEHEQGWRAQLAYPRNLFLPPTALPFTLAEIQSRLKTLTTSRIDIFV